MSTLQHQLLPLTLLYLLYIAIQATIPAVHEREHAVHEVAARQDLVTDSAQRLLCHHSRLGRYFGSRLQLLPAKGQAIEEVTCGQIAINVKTKSLLLKHLFEHLALSHINVL